MRPKNSKARSVAGNAPSSAHGAPAAVSDAPGSLTAREAQELLAMVEIGRIVSSSLNMDQVFSTFADLVRPLVPFDRLVVVAYDPAADTWADLYVSGLSLPGFPRGAVYPNHETLGPVVLRDHRTIVMDDAAVKEAADKYTAVREGLAIGLRSVMMVPLIWQNEVFGTLNFRSRSAGAYGPLEQATAERIGAQVAGGIATRHMVRQLEREAEVRRSLASIGLAASSDLDLENVFERTADEIARLLPYDRLSISLLDQQAGVLRLRFFRGVELPERPLGGQIPVNPDIPRWRSMFQRNITEGVFYGKEADLRSSVTRSAKWMPAVGNIIQSRLEVPLGTEVGGAIGYLGLSSLKPNAFSLEDLGLLEKVALQITPAIQNAIVHQRTLELAEERARTANLESHTRELERLNHARSQFLSTITHELKTPLTSIMAFADILSRNRSENLTTRQVEQINIVRRNATHLHGLINDLLDISKTEAGRMALSERRVDMAALLQEVASSMEAYFASRKQTLKVETRGEVAVLGDRERLEQVITNLLSNAAKYSRPETTVTVTVGGDAQWCSLSVKDQGIGMSDEEQLHLFSPFYRSDNSITREADGVGLGLAIVKHIVDIHAGRIDVESAPGKGSTFTVYLPTRLELGATG